MSIYRIVTIPAREEHEGFYQVDVVLPWTCMVCGGPRGEPAPVRSYDGSRWMMVDGWTNPCGHVEKYSAIRKWFVERQATPCQQQQANAGGKRRYDLHKMHPAGDGSSVWCALIFGPYKQIVARGYGPTWFAAARAALAKVEGA